MTQIPPMSGPYLRKNKSVRRSMLLVMAALTPATAYGFYLFGWPSIILFCITLGSAMIFEVICLLLAKRSVSIFALDGSALLTAWLLAISMPPWAPWWIAVVGSGIAIIIGKQVFGGLGQNVFNPAMVARVALLISFPLEMTTYMPPIDFMSAGAPSFMDGMGIIFGTANFDAVSSASLLDSIKTNIGQGKALGDIMEGQYSPVNWALGNSISSIGEGAALLLIAGGVALIFGRIITWYIPVSTLVTIAVFATIFNLYDGSKYPDAMVHLLSGATMLAVFFIATDPVTSPMSPKGQIVFGIGLGALVYIIRTWAAYPEGMSFAILLMNALTPLIDRYVRPRIFGRTRKGDPLNLSEKP
ncbi:MAG: RnfABCDGE type electron transport complex subunit D [Emcibacter sp.]|nr:RnfABCDGE type electron transport complex subunit D [Emcibacter sp.]